MIRSRLLCAGVAVLAWLPLRPAVAADPAPEFEVSSSPITISVAPCGHDCGLTAWFAPEVKQTFANVSITNKSKTPLTLTVAFDASGAYPGEWPRSVSACLQAPGAPPAPCNKEKKPADLRVEVDGRATLRIEVDASTGPPPGKYAGNLLVTATAVEKKSQASAVDGAGEPPAKTTKSIALTVRVRAEAVVALLAILAGIIGGRLFKQITAQDAVQQMALYGRYLRLRESPPLDASHPFTAWWNNALDAIKNQLDQSAPDATVIAAAVKKLEDTATLMRSIASIRAFVNNLPTVDPRRQKVVTELDEALAAIVSSNLDLAKTKYESARADAFAVSASSPPVMAALGTLAPTVRASFASLDAAASPTRDMASKTRAGVISALNWISGDAAVPADIAYSYVRPILTLLLLAVLAVYGMWQNYSGSDDVAATFGAQGIASYAIIFLWGFSSQIIASTLQTLKFDRATTPAKP